MVAKLQLLGFRFISLNNLSEKSPPSPIRNLDGDLDRGDILHLDPAAVLLCLWHLLPGGGEDGGGGGLQGEAARLNLDLRESFAIILNKNHPQLLSAGDEQISSRQYSFYMRGRTENFYTRRGQESVVIMVFLLFPSSTLLLSWLLLLLLLPGAAFSRFLRLIFSNSDSISSLLAEFGLRADILIQPQHSMMAAKHPLS